MHHSMGIFSRRYLSIVFWGMIFTILLALLASSRFSTYLSGLPSHETIHLDSGWVYEDGNSLSLLEELPCTITYPENTLHLYHDVTSIKKDPKDVLTFRTRYASIRIWADDALIYEAAQGKDHAIGSMWHFIPLTDFADASTLRVELTKYDNSPQWELPAVLLDCSGTLQVHLLHACAPAILFWMFSLLFVCLLLLTSVFMLGQKIPAVRIALSLAGFIFLSGQWVLLDSKIPTLFGGNYAVVYFLSYLAFYLLMVPFLLFIQQMLRRRNRILHALPLFFIGNTVLCMGLHLAGLVPIHKTTFTVHILIFITILISTKELFHGIIKGGNRKLLCTFLGMLVIYGISILSILLYGTGHLPDANSGILYIWGILILILGMTMDTIFSMNHIWKQKQHLDHYKQLAIQDTMTLLGNRNAFELHLQHLLSHPPQQLLFILLDVDNLKTINDTKGHHVGDQIIYVAAQCILEVFGSLGPCYRIGGDEFSILLIESHDVDQKLQQFEALFQKQCCDLFPTSVSYGWAEKSFDADCPLSVNDLIALKQEADENLYRQKRQHKQEQPPKP